MKIEFLKRFQRFFLFIKFKKEYSAIPNYWNQKILQFHIGFSNSILKIEDIEINGNWMNGVVIFGLAIGFGVVYDFGGGKPMSEALTRFYRDYARWLDDGAPDTDDTPFSRYVGLCNNSILWKDFYDPWNQSYSTFDLLKELEDQFKEYGLDPKFPFGSFNYEIRCNAGAQHLDLKRNRWVRNHVEN